MDWQRHVTAASGYLDLGMGQEAWDELGSMAPEDRARVEVVVMRLVVLQSMQRWDEGAEIARGAIRANPGRPDLYIMGAYAIRRTEGVEAALEFLTSGEEHMEDDPTYWFNIGCYHCQLGGLAMARRCVDKAVEMDKQFQKMALGDDDLEPLWDELGRSAGDSP